MIKCELCQNEFNDAISCIPKIHDKRYYNFCRGCLFADINGWYDYTKIEEIFEKLDIPFIEFIWHNCISLAFTKYETSPYQYDTTYQLITKQSDMVKLLVTFDEYIGKANLPSNNQMFFNKGFEHSKFFSEGERRKAEETQKQMSKDFLEQLVNSVKRNALKPTEDDNLDLLDEYGHFKIELLSDNDFKYLQRKWGNSYTIADLVWLEEYWIKAHASFEINNSIHRDLLIKIAKISLKVDKSFDADDFDQGDKLSKTMEKLMDSAKFTPKSKSSAAERNFVSNVGELVRYIEDKGGFIPRHDIKVPKDIMDATIENLNNFTRRLVMGEMNLDNKVEEYTAKMQAELDKPSDELSEEMDDIIYDDDFDALNDSDNPNVEYYDNKIMNLESFREQLRKVSEEF